MKILVRAPNWLGDALMSGPFIRALRYRHPDAALHVAGPAGLGEILSIPGVVDRFFTVARSESPFALGRRLREDHYDAGYALPPSFSSALALWWARIPRRVGYAADGRSVLLTESLVLDERFHYVRRYLGLLGEAGRDVGPEDFYFPLSEEADEKAADLLRKSGVPEPSLNNKTILALAPGSRAPARRWPAENFAALADRLDRNRYPAVILLGAPEDQPMADETVRRAARPAINLCGQTSLPVLGAVLRRCAALVTNESGLMHVGWAVGAPTVVLAGPSEPAATSPFGAKVRVLQRRDIPCVPCVKNVCYRPGKGYMECLRGISIEAVQEALEKLKNTPHP
jgi:heptosyltransferase-2